MPFASASGESSFPVKSFGDHFTLIYQVSVKDMRSPDSMADEIAARRGELARYVAGGTVSKTDAPARLAEEIAFIKHDYANAESGLYNQAYTVTISSDGDHFLCSSNADANDTENVSIYSYPERCTYYYATEESGQTLYIDPGFNQSTDLRLPLLWYTVPNGELVFLKDGQLTSSSGAQQVWYGKSFSVPNRYEAISDPIYNSSQCSINSGHTVDECSLYDSGNLMQDWKYGSYSNTGLGTIPASITMTQYQPLWLGDKWSVRPREQLVYTLVSATGSALDTREFDVQYWIPKHGVVSVNDSAFDPKSGKMYVFNYSPGLMTLKDTIAKNIWGEAAQEARLKQSGDQMRPVLPIVGAVLIVTSVWLLRKRRLAMSQRPRTY